jgi:hypothetical protein
LTLGGLDESERLERFLADLLQPGLGDFLSALRGSIWETRSSTALISTFLPLLATAKPGQ